MFPYPWQGGYVNFAVNHRRDCHRSRGLPCRSLHRLLSRKGRPRYLELVCNAMVHVDWWSRTCPTPIPLQAGHCRYCSGYSCCHATLTKGSVGNAFLEGHAQYTLFLVSLRSNSYDLRLCIENDILQN